MLPRHSPVIIEATTVATARCEFPRTRERDRDQATSITREAAPDRNNPAEITRRTREGLKEDCEADDRFLMQARDSTTSRLHEEEVQRRSKRKTSESSGAWSTTARSSLRAAPSPSLRSFPLMRTAPRATCTQAFRPA